jgi:predicted permease
METFLQDLRYSIRSLRGGGVSFTVAAVLALAIGIGANTAIFSLVNAVLLKPPPFPDADRIVVFETKQREGAFAAGSPAKFAHWARQTSVVQDVAAFRNNVVNWTDGRVPRQLRSESVSSGYFRLFGVPFVLGRPFNAQEDKPNGPHVAVVSEGLWKGQFGSDPKIIGKTLTLGGDAYVVTGVVSSRFDFQDFGPAPEVWTPFQLDPDSVNQGHYFLVTGRIKTGVSIQQANARLAASAGEYRRRFPDALRKDDSFDVKDMRDSLVQRARTSIWILVGAVSFVLLIACANVANLLLARAEVRKRELAIRASLGAGKFRIARQLLTESLLLSAAGAVLGLILGIIGIHALLSVNTAGLPRVGVDGALVSIDWRVLCFTIAITLLTSLIFGLIPALHSMRVDLSSTIKESASRTGSGFRQNKTRTVLVVSEVALAVVLLVGAGLLIRTGLALYAVQPGFDAKKVLTMHMSLAGRSFQTSASIEQLVRQGTERIQSIPGVELASATCCIPLEGGYGLPFKIMGRPLKDGPFHGGGGWKTVSPGYFEVFRIRVIKGRTFTERDSKSGSPVVVINEALAKRFWPKADPLQARILIGKGMMPELADEQPRQIVGVVADQRDGALNQDPQPEMYIPNGQATDAIQALNVSITPLKWVIRTRGEPLSVRAPVQKQLEDLTGLPVSDVRSMSEVVSRSTGRERFHMLLMSVFGGVALILAAIGIYGLMAYSVEQRTQEIGIRMALGAERGDVQSMIMRQGFVFAVIGVVIGTGTAFAVAKQMASLLFGVKPWDPLVLSTIPFVLLATALVATWRPAHRATEVDPAITLRQT